MDDTLVVEVLETVQNLGHIHADQVLGELSVSLEDRVKGSIFAVSRGSVRVRSHCREEGEGMKGQRQVHRTRG